MNARRGAVVLIRHGDPEIAGAIEGGMMKASEGDLIRRFAPPSPEGEVRGNRPLTGDEVEVVEAEIDRQRIQAALLRVAVNNHKTPEDYRQMIIKARGDYAVDTREPGPLRRFGRWLVGWHALLMLALRRAYEAQDIVLGRR